MPRGDRTGPTGFGPMTGRAAGYCAGFGVPGYTNPIPAGFGARGRRRWPGRGPGRGMGRFFWPGGAVPYAYGAHYAPAEPQEERRFLEGQSRVLQEQLEDIKQRLDEIAAEQSKSE